MRFIRQWLKKEDGSTAVEFAMVSLPFIYILIGIMEMSIMFATNSVLDGAVVSAARLIRTGQVQQAAGNPETLFRNKLCEKSAMLVKCAKLQYEVVPMTSFASYSQYAPVYDKSGNLKPRGFTPGGVNTVNLIRVYYRYQLATPFIGKLLANGPNNSRMMISTIVLETEPYDMGQIASQL